MIYFTIKWLAPLRQVVDYKQTQNIFKISVCKTRKTNSVFVCLFWTMTDRQSFGVCYGSLLSLFCCTFCFVLPLPFVCCRFIYTAKQSKKSAFFLYPHFIEWHGRCCVLVKWPKRISNCHRGIRCWIICPKGKCKRKRQQKRKWNK